MCTCVSQGLYCSSKFPSSIESFLYQLLGLLYSNPFLPQLVVETIGALFAVLFFFYLLSLDLFGAQVLAHAVHSVTPQLAVPPSWIRGCLLACPDGRHGRQWPCLSPKTDGPL